MFKDSLEKELPVPDSFLAEEEVDEDAPEKSSRLMESILKVQQQMAEGQDQMRFEMRMRKEEEDMDRKRRAKEEERDRRKRVSSSIRLASISRVAIEIATFWGIFCCCRISYPIHF